MTTATMSQECGPSHTTENHYDVLGINREASLEEIKAAHRRLALRLHPDKQTSCSESQDEETHQFTKIQAAWECLSDPQLKAIHDEDLKRNKDRSRSKRQAAMSLRLEEMEECVDQDDGSLGYIYACRCGQDVEYWPDCKTRQGPEIMLECSGCSLAFCIVLDEPE